MEPPLKLLQELTKWIWTLALASFGWTAYNELHKEEKDCLVDCDGEWWLDLTAVSLDSSPSVELLSCHRHKRTACLMILTSTIKKNFTHSVQQKVPCLGKSFWLPARLGRSMSACLWGAAHLGPGPPGALTLDPVGNSLAAAAAAAGCLPASSVWGLGSQELSVSGWVWLLL